MVDPRRENLGREGLKQNVKKRFSIGEGFNVGTGRTDGLHRSGRYGKSTPSTTSQTVGSKEIVDGFEVGSANHGHQLGFHRFILAALLS